jgi:hypothetical protein
MTSVGVAFGDDLMNPDNRDHVIARIRRDYLADSTVTLLLLAGSDPPQAVYRLGTQSIPSAGPELHTQWCAWGSASIGQRVWSISPSRFCGELESGKSRYYFNPTSRQQL